MNIVDELRINRAIDLIQQNIGNPLSIDFISNSCGVSKFYLAHLFKDSVGESVHAFIKRLRMEKAAALLVQNRSKPITEIALLCGFDNSSSFSKSFKQFFDCSPSVWRKNNAKPKNGDVEKNAFKKMRRAGSWAWTTFHDGDYYRVTIQDIPNCKVAYVRNIGAFQNDTQLFSSLHAKLGKWSENNGALNKPKNFNLFHDNLSVTPAEKLQVMAAIAVQDNVIGDGEVAIRSIQFGQYAYCCQTIKPSQFGDLWKLLLNYWLPQSGYEWDDRVAFESVVGHHNREEQTYLDVEFGLPIRKKR